LRGSFEAILIDLVIPNSGLHRRILRQGLPDRSFHQRQPVRDVSRKQGTRRNRKQRKRRTHFGRHRTRYRSGRRNLQETDSGEKNLTKTITCTVKAAHVILSIRDRLKLIILTK
jgi:hypothetical protein